MRYRKKTAELSKTIGSSSGLSRKFSVVDEVLRQEARFPDDICNHGGLKARVPKTLSIK
jgi:hypothetical protein